jgi:hypothetical protein
VRYFRVQHPAIGFFQQLLMGGDCDHGPDGVLRVYRTGPFAPPLMLPGMGYVIVTEEFCMRYARAELTGLSFGPARKERIVEVLWETWDRNDEDAFLAAVEKAFPNIEDAFDIVLRQPHSDRAAQSMPTLYEAQFQERVGAEVIERHDPWDHRIRITIPEAASAKDFLRAERQRYIFASDRAKEWLESFASEWVYFYEVEVVASKS